jgi:hypothetical protein
MVVGVGYCSTADRTFSLERDDDSAADMADGSALVCDDDAWGADVQLENAPL